MIDLDQIHRDALERWPATREFLKTELPGYIMLIRKPNDLTVYGPCENSFSLSTEAYRTFLFWTSPKQKIDGLEWLRRDLKDWKQLHPDWQYNIYDARAENLPVVLDWEKWLDAHYPAEDTLSGVTNKYLARNLSFSVKPDARIQGTFEF